MCGNDRDLDDDALLHVSKVGALALLDNVHIVQQFELLRNQSAAPIRQRFHQAWGKLQKKYLNASNVKMVSCFRNINCTIGIVEHFDMMLRGTLKDRTFVDLKSKEMF